MARRRIGQERMAFVAEVRGRNAGLDALAAAVDWTEIDAALAGVYAAARGERAWPPLALFKGLLLAVWHDLSDVRLAEALDDRASFRRFCGFATTEPVPERTAFVRFRRELVARGLDAKLFRTVVRQLEAKDLVVKTGTLVDATVVEAASRGDVEAGWCIYAGPHRTPVHGYKAHVATDEEGGIVRRVAVTPANIRDAAAMVLPRNPGRVWADSGYAGRKTEARIRRSNGTPRVMRPTGGRLRPTLKAARQAWNAAIRPVRCRIEKIFGTAKRSYGLARCRWRGLARATLQVHLTFIAFNLTRAAALLRPQPA